MANKVTDGATKVDERLNAMQEYVQSNVEDAASQMYVESTESSDMLLNLVQQVMKELQEHKRVQANTEQVLFERMEKLSKVTEDLCAVAASTVSAVPAEATEALNVLTRRVNTMDDRLGMLLLAPSSPPAPSPNTPNAPVASPNTDEYDAKLQYVLGQCDTRCKGVEERGETIKKELEKGLQVYTDTHVLAAVSKLSNEIGEVKHSAFVGIQTATADFNGCIVDVGEIRGSVSVVQQELSRVYELNDKQRRHQAPNEGGSNLEGHRCV